MTNGIRRRGFLARALRFGAWLMVPTRALALSATSDTAADVNDTLGSGAEVSLAQRPVTAGGERNLAAAFQADDIDAALVALFGDDSIPVSAAITIDADDLAEDGAIVPVAVAVGDAIAPEAIRHLYLFASKNPVPTIARFSFPFGLYQPFRTRVKLAGTSTVVVVVETTQACFRQSRSIEVAVGGCSVMA